jgi:Leucine-rich repeat (LRR) protein
VASQLHKRTKRVRWDRAVESYARVIAFCCPIALLSATAGASEAVSFCGQRLQPNVVAVRCFEAPDEEPVSLVPLAKFSRLRELELGAIAIMDWSHLTKLTQLKSLKLHAWERAMGGGEPVYTGLPPMEVLAQLRRLRTLSLDIGPTENVGMEGGALGGTASLDLGPLAALVHLTELEVLGGDAEVESAEPPEVHGLDDLSNLRGLTLAAVKLVSTPGLRMQRLRRLDVSNVKGFDLESAVLAQKRLTELVTDVLPPTGLDRIATAHPGLESIDVPCASLRNLDAVGLLRQLRALRLAQCMSAKLAPLAALHQLERLNLEGSVGLDLTPLVRLKRLASLNLSSTDIVTLEPLRTLRSLRELDLSGTAPRALSPLAALPLRRLGLAGMQSIDLLGLVSLRDTLKVLDVSGSTIRKLAPLSAFKRLSVLDLMDSPATDVEERIDLRPLLDLPRLKRLDASGTRARTCPDDDPTEPDPGCEVLRALEERGVIIETHTGYGC